MANPYGRPCRRAVPASGDRLDRFPKAIPLTGLLGGEEAW